MKKKISVKVRTEEDNNNFKKESKDGISFRKLFIIVLVLIITAVVMWFIFTKTNINTFDYIPVLVVVVFIISITILFSLIPDSAFFNKQKTYKRRKNDLITEAKVKRDIWQRSAIMWQILNYFLQGISTISLGIIVYLSTKQNGDQSILLYSIISFEVVFATLILNPNKVSNAYSQSYVDIYTALVEYDANIIDEKVIAKILSKCEQRITDYSH